MICSEVKKIKDICWAIFSQRAPVLAACPACSNQRLLLRLCHPARPLFWATGTPANKPRDLCHKAFGGQTLMPRGLVKGADRDGAAWSGVQTGTAWSTATRHRNGTSAWRGPAWGQAGFVGVPLALFSHRRGTSSLTPPWPPPAQCLCVQESGCCSRCWGTSSGLGGHKELSN